MFDFTLRVLEGWFVLGIVLGLCWIAACVVARGIADLVAGVAPGAFARRPILALLPAVAVEEAARGEVFHLALGLVLQRRSVPSRDASARVAPAPSRVRSQA